MASNFHRARYTIQPEEGEDNEDVIKSLHRVGRNLKGLTMGVR
jgi:hypothetical protein